MCSGVKGGGGEGGVVGESKCLCLNMTEGKGFL